MHCISAASHLHPLYPSHSEYQCLMQDRSQFKKMVSSPKKSRPVVKRRQQGGGMQTGHARADREAATVKLHHECVSEQTGETFNPAYVGGSHGPCITTTRTRVRE